MRHIKSQSPLYPQQWTMFLNKGVLVLKFHNLPFTFRTNHRVMNQTDANMVNSIKRGVIRPVLLFFFTVFIYMHGVN